MLPEIHTTAVAVRLMEFLEGAASTMPQWRLQAEGLGSVVALRRQGHPGPSSIPRRRCDATATGFVLEIEERWTRAGQDWYCREMIRAAVEGGSISNISVYCTGLGFGPSGPARCSCAITTALGRYCACTLLKAILFT